MENTETSRMRKYSKQTGTNTYAAPMRSVNESGLEPKMERSVIISPDWC